VDAAQPAEGGAEDEEEPYEDPEDPFTEEVRLQKLEMQRRGEEEDDPDYISEDEVGLPQLMSLPARTLLFTVVLKISPTRLPTGNSTQRGRSACRHGQTNGLARSPTPQPREPTQPRGNVGKEAGTGTPLATVS
jgi:hypothetical protein